MRVVLLPYQLQVGRLSRNSKSLPPMDKALKRLQSYMGVMPRGTKILADRDRAGISIADMLYRQIIGADKLHFSWQNPANRKDKDCSHFEPVFKALMTVETPLVIMVIPSIKINRYAELVGELMGIRHNNLSSGSGGRMVLIDPRASEAVRLVAI